MSDSQSNPDPQQSADQDIEDRQASEAPQRPVDAPRDPSESPERGYEPTAADRFREHVSQSAASEDYEQETSLWKGGYSPKAMVGMWVGMGVATVVIIVAAVLIEVLGFLVALGLIVLMWLLGGLVYLWRRLGIHYELTTQRFIHRDGVMTRHTDRIEVIDISDVSYRQGPVERVFGVGTIVITSSDQSHPELTMLGIDQVGQVASLIDDTRRKERRKRSLHLRQM